LHNKKSFHSFLSQQEGATSGISELALNGESNDDFKGSDKGRKQTRNSLDNFMSCSLAGSDDHAIR